MAEVAHVAGAKRGGGRSKNCKWQTPWRVLANKVFKTGLKKAYLLNKS